MPADSQTPPAFFVQEDGNVTIFSVFMLVLILTLTGASVDIMRFEASRTKMQATLDRAVLAAADLDQGQDPTAVVNDYVAKAGMADVLTGITVEASNNSRVVAASGNIEMDTIFLHMTGFDTLSAQGVSAAEERISNVEISLVLDISGSMRFNSRMDNLKPAAVSFVEKVMDDDSNGVTTLNLIPFAGQVNPGDILFDYFRGERPVVEVIPPAETGDFFPAWGQAISNAVFYFDTDGDDIYDIAHKIEGWPEGAPRDIDEMFAGAVGYMLQNDPNLSVSDTFLGASIKGGVQTTQYFTVYGDSNGPSSDLGPTQNKGRIPGSTFTYGQIDYEYWSEFYDGGGALPDNINVNMPSSCVEIYNHEFGDSSLPSSSDFVPHFNYWPYDEEVMDWGWCPSEDAAIQYYSSNTTQLTEFINNLRMHDGTGAQYGMKYALSLLDPATRSAVSHLIDEGLVAPQFLGRPIAWDDLETEKYIVLMTDGQVTDQYRPNDPTAAVNGEVALQNQDSGSYSMLSSKSTNITNLQAQCDLARTLGVVVFTIAFETDDAAAADMRACASSESHFFHVHGEEITDTFDMIARQINNLRLIQ